MSLHALFVEAVRAAEGLPTLLREHASDVVALEERQLDVSYIEFLDEQIELSPRGPEWTEVLKRRRAALHPYCGVILLDGSVQVGRTRFWVKIHPQTKAVIQWEEHECGPAD